MSEQPINPAFRNGTLMADWRIKEYVEKHNMLTNFCAEKSTKVVGEYRNNQKAISYGLSSVGYDARLDTEFACYVKGEYISPKNVLDHQVQKTVGMTQPFFLKPHSFLLGKTVEYFNMPTNVMAIAVGKSTYARAGIIINVTPIEPGWHGNVVIEISNTTDSYIEIFPNEGIAQFLFFEFAPEYAPTKDYPTLGGKYQGQTGVTLPKT